LPHGLDGALDDGIQIRNQQGQDHGYDQNQANAHADNQFSRLAHLLTPLCSDQEL
jgi:hypothetical protein